MQILSLLCGFAVDLTAYLGIVTQQQSRINTAFQPLILVSGFEVLSLNFSSFIGVSVSICCVSNHNAVLVSRKIAIMLTKAALTVVPCKMQELHTPSLLRPVARTSMHSQDNALLLFVSVQC